jgi:hypothetical protein
MLLNMLLRGSNDTMLYRDVITPLAEQCMMCITRDSHNLGPPPTSDLSLKCTATEHSAFASIAGAV